MRLQWNQDGSEAKIRLVDRSHRSLDPVLPLLVDLLDLSAAVGESLFFIFANLASAGLDRRSLLVQLREHLFLPATKCSQAFALRCP